MIWFYAMFSLRGTYGTLSTTAQLSLELLEHMVLPL